MIDWNSILLKVAEKVSPFRLLLVLLGTALVVTGVITYDQLIDGIVRLIGALKGIF